MALQNQSKLYIDMSTLWAVQNGFSTYLGDACRIGLHDCTESSEGGVPFLVTPDLAEQLATAQGKLRQEWGDETRVHQSNLPYRDGGVRVQTSGSLCVHQNRNQP